MNNIAIQTAITASWIINSVIPPEVTITKALSPIKYTIIPTRKFQKIEAIIEAERNFLKGIRKIPAAVSVKAPTFGSQ